MRLRNLFLILLLCSGHAFATDPALHVLTTIKPLQLIAGAVVGDAAEVEVLLGADVSPHDYQLKPSDRAKLARADVVFWVGPGLETFLQRALTSLPALVHVEAFQPSGGHDVDAHIWMDPLAAIEIGRQIAAALTQIRPEQAAYWQSNARKLEADLTRLDRQMAAQFALLKQRQGYFVSHDAFGGFERRYGLKHVLALSDGHELPPGPRRMMEVRALIEHGDIGCALLEPQYDRKVIDAVIGQSSVQRVQIDPLAKNVLFDARRSSPDTAVMEFYRGMAQAMADCVSR